MRGLTARPVRGPAARCLRGGVSVTNRSPFRSHVDRARPARSSSALVVSAATSGGPVLTGLRWGTLELRRADMVVPKNCRHDTPLQCNVKGEAASVASFVGIEAQ